MVRGLGSGWGVLALFLAAGPAAAGPAGGAAPMSDADFRTALSAGSAGVLRQAVELRAGLADSPQDLCQRVVDDAASVTDQDALEDCVEFYWHNGQHDVGWNKNIRLHRRLIELDPAEAQHYGTCAWLLWSKWVRWSQDPEGMPDGAGKKEESIAVFESGLSANSGSAAFLAAYASHMDSFLKEYPRAIELWKQVELRAADPKSRIRARMSLGNDYRKSGRPAEAVSWYRAVLELDPENRNALAYLRQLGKRVQSGLE